MPPITCYPDDADNPMRTNCSTKAGDKIAGLIFKHNDAPILWFHMHSLYSALEGMTACYTYTKVNKKYGTYEEKQYGEDAEQHQVGICPLCQAQMTIT